MMDITLKPSPGNPLPPNHVAGTFQSHDGLALRYAVFRSGEGTPRGTVVLLQGRNEQIEKYAETIADLNAMGLWVATFDWRGQGGSPRLHANPRRGHLRHFTDLERDLDRFLEHIVLPDAKLPFHIVAHSMGALVALKAAPRLANRIERMVLLAPFLGIAGQGPRMTRIRLAARLATLAGLGFMQFNADVFERPFTENKVTSDPVRYARNVGIVRAHPSFGIGPPTARWISEMVSAIDQATDFRHLTSITVPTLVLAPSKDKVVPYPAMEKLATRFRAARVVTIPGAGHELLQERDIFRAQALAAIAAFIPGSDAEALAFDEA